MADIKRFKSDEEFREFALNGNMRSVIAYVSLPLMIYQGLMQLFKILDTVMAAHIGSRTVSSLAYT